MKGILLKSINVNILFVFSHKEIFYFLFFLDRRAGFAVSRNEQTTELLRRHEMEVSTLANLSSFTVCEKDENTLRM